MITSKQNALVKEIRSLADKKYRDRLNLFIIEGVKPVKEAVEKGVSIREIVGTARALNALGVEFSSVVEVSDEVFDYISEESTPQGVLAVAFKPENKLVSPVGNCILLDGVSDPSNVGAIIRTAVASGYDTIYTTNDCADPYAQKAVRSSMSGVFRAKIVRGKIEELLSVINMPIVVADMYGKNVFETQNGMASFIALAKTYMARGGQQLSVNVVSAQDLLEARKYPEKYKTLVVRVGGYSAHFNDLSPELQENIIARTLL